jgi:hypothetical protein
MLYTRVIRMEWWSDASADAGKGWAPKVVLEHGSISVFSIIIRDKVYIRRH